MGKIITGCEREIEMKAAQRVGADGVQVFTVKLEAAIDKHDATFLRRFNVFTPKSIMYQSGMVFKLMVGKAAATVRLEDVTHHFPASAK